MDNISKRLSVAAVNTTVDALDTDAPLTRYERKKRGEPIDPIVYAGERIGRNQIVLTADNLPIKFKRTETYRHVPRTRLSGVPDLRLWYRASDSPPSPTGAAPDRPVR